LNALTNLSHDEKAEMVGEVIFYILPLFVIGSLFNMRWELVSGTIVFMASRFAYDKSFDTWFHMPIDKFEYWCPITMYSIIFFGFGIIPLGLSASLPIVFYGQPLLPILVAIITGFLITLLGDWQHEQDTLIETLKSKIDAFKWGVGHYKYKAKIARTITLDNITLDEYNLLCTILSMSEIDVELGKQSIIDKIPVSKMYEQNEFSNSFEAAEQRIYRLRKKIRDNLNIITTL